MDFVEDDKRAGGGASLPLRLREGDKKLRVVGVRTRVSHGECSGAGVL